MPLLRLSVELIMWTTGLLAVVITLMLVLIVGRRWKRLRYFRDRDRARQELQPVIEQLLNGVESPLKSSLSNVERDVLEDVLLARLEEDPERHAAIIAFFEQYGFVDRQLARLKASSAWARAQAAMTLGRMRSQEGILGLIDALDDRATDVRLAAVRSLTLLGSPVAAVPLVQFLLRGAPGVPSSAIIPALATCCRGTAGTVVEILATAADNAARIVAAAALAEISTPMIRGQLEPYLYDGDPEVRARIAAAIGRLRDWAAVGALVGLVDDAVWFVRLRAVQALGEIGDWRALPALLKAVQDEHWQVRSQVAQILGQHEWLVSSVIESVEHSNDRYAWQALISELERAGLIWKAIGQLHSAEARVRSDAQTIVASAIRAGALRATLHALETFPDAEVVLELADLIRQNLRPEDRHVIQSLSHSAGVAPKVRHLLEGAMAERIAPLKLSEPKRVRG